MALLEELPTLIETDARGRTTLPGRNQRYVLHQQSDGALVLEPAIVMTEAERKFLANTELQERIAYLDAHPEEFVKSERREARRRNH